MWIGSFWYLLIFLKAAEYFKTEKQAQQYILFFFFLLILCCNELHEDSLGWNNTILKHNSKLQWSVRSKPHKPCYFFGMTTHALIEFTMD